MFFIKKNLNFFFKYFKFKKVFKNFNKNLKIFYIFKKKLFNIKDYIIPSIFNGFIINSKKEDLVINLFRFRNLLISKTKKVYNQILLFGVNNKTIKNTWYDIIFYIKKFFFKNIKNFQIFQIVYEKKIYFFNIFFKINYFIKKNKILEIFINLVFKFYFFYYKLLILNILKFNFIIIKCLKEKKN